MVAMFVNRSGRNDQSLQRTFHRCFPPSFGSFGQMIQRRRFLRNRPIRNKNCLWWPRLLTCQDEMSNLSRGPSIDASYQVSVHLAQRFQRRRFKKIDQSKTGISCSVHACKGIGTKCAIFIEDLPQILPTKFKFIWLSGFRGED